MFYLVVGTVAVAGLGYSTYMYFFKKEEQETQEQPQKQQVEEPQKNNFESL